MDFSLTPTFMGRVAEADVLARLARIVDESGLYGLWVPDHIVYPADMPSDYPYTSSGEFAHEGLTCLESVTALAWLAPLVPRARLGVSVIVIPNRNPVLMAKSIATLDVLTGGRVMLGAGAGWLRAEFDALDADFEARGAVTDEYLSVYQTLCRDERPQFEGEHYRLSDIVFAPKPVQRPWPPIHIGGNSTPAVRRAARLGDGWQPVSLPIEDVPHARARLDAQCEAAGRDPADVRLSLRCFYHVTGTPFDAQVRETLSPGQYLAEPAALAEQFRGFAEHGVEEVLFTPMLRHDSDLYVDQVERLIAAL